MAADHERGAGRRQHAAEQRLAARGGDARRDRGLEHLARLARVADHEHARAAAAGDPRRGGAGERERQLRGDDLARDSADAVGAEQLADPARLSRAGPWRAVRSSIR